ncbi:MAG: hypothetical protein AMJ62_07880 [Myxococcales bacterium SG8_38]|nr:MAG: hypothetical protein AMJ62_07880 [Myxococcales bacterium SG8_38]
MFVRKRHVAVLIGSFLASLGCSSSDGGSADDVFSVEAFASPPPEFRPQTRWWWPGGAVDESTLRAHLRQLSEAGYGSVEIQPFMSAITNTDIADDDRIRTVGDAAFRERLRDAACAAQELGLSWDLTLGSGWSTGGINVDTDSERQLIAAELTLSGPDTYMGPLPQGAPPPWIEDTNAVVASIDGFDEDLALVAVLAAEVIDEPSTAPATLGEVVDLTSQVSERTLTWEVPAGTHRVFAVYENRTFHFPAGGAYPGELEDARVIDHLDRRGVEAFLEREFGAWIEAVRDCPPRSVFVDSFELVGELPWTTALGSKLETALGYDIELLLPFLFREGGESEYVNLLRGIGDPRYQAPDQRGIRAREDYERVRGDVFSEELIATLRTWLHERAIDLRLQAHGGYADVLDAYGMADIPESEGLFGGGSYDFLRLAASAAHVGGKRFASSETFPRNGALELSEIDARILMGRAFSAGINRLVHHGNAYPYLHSDGQRWYPFHPLEDSAFTTGPLDITFDIHPGADIWAALPSLNRWAARLSYALSRGTAKAEVAWLYPEWRAENFVNFGVEPGAYESEISIALRRAGFEYDRISRSALASSSASNGMLRVGDASFRALLVDGLSVAAPEMLKAIVEATNAGVPVIWAGDFPTRADGLVDSEARDAEVASLVETLRSSVRVVSAVEQIASAITNETVTPPLRPVDSAGLRMSVARREVSGGDIYFLFNESYEARTDRMRIEGGFSNAQLLDPETGETEAPNIEDGILTITLQAARGKVLWLLR